MRRESLPLAPEIVVDQHARFEQPQDSPLYAHTMALLAELRARYFVLSHTGCSRPTRNPRIEFGRGYALFDQISFPSWLEDGRDCLGFGQNLHWHAINLATRIVVGASRFSV